MEAPDDEFWRRYPPPLRAVSVAPVSERGGFSGGRVWKCETPSGPMALRCWTHGFPRARIVAIHHLLRAARAGGWSVVPNPAATSLGTTSTEHAGHAWELCTWMAGSPAESPISDERLRSSARLLARWHCSGAAEIAGRHAAPFGDEATLAAWRAGSQTVSPAYTRRWREWVELAAELKPGAEDERFASLTARLAAAVERIDSQVDAWLHECAAPSSLRLCLRDVHREHVLFEGDEVVGLIDFGAVAVDAPAVDLSRWLGSVAPSEMDRWPVAVEAYREIAPLTVEEVRTIEPLYRVSTVIAALHWWKWLVASPRSFPNPAAAAARWEELIRRVEAFAADDQRMARLPFAKSSDRT